MKGSRVGRWSWLAAGLALTLGAASAASWQEPGSLPNASPAAEQRAAPAAPPRRRDRRRETEAAAATPSAASPAATAAETAAPELICKNIKAIGSRVARRICGTEEQWAASSARTRADAAESMRQIRGRSGVTGGSSSGPASLGGP